jgi:thiosulfate/3-mercaptopyruvate sulfurtransferase
MFIALLIWSCGKNKSPLAKETSHNYLIESTELAKVIDLPSTKILDFRSQELYSRSHILNAINISRKDIEDSSYPYSGVIPSKNQLEKLFSKLGIQTQDTIILYDDKGMCEAARLWWILQNYDFHNVRILNGGFESWQATNGRTSKVAPKFLASNFKLPDNPSMSCIVSNKDVLDAISANAVIIDTRTIEEFEGTYMKPGSKRAGRIPNSIHIDWALNINFDGDQKFKSRHEIEKNYAHLNLEESERIIVYCHSGVRSAHTTFVLAELLGFDNVKNYDGSWVEWSYDKDSPIEFDTF